MSNKRLPIIVTVLALCALAIWIHYRRSAEEGPHQNSRPIESSTATKDHAHLRQTTPESRAKLLEAIRKVQELRSRNGTATGGQAESNGGGTAPALDDGSSDSDGAYLQSAMEDIVPMLMDCYHQGLKRDPSMAGHVVVNFTIEGEKDIGGVISESKIEPDGTDLTDTDVQQCIQNTIYSLELDPPEGGVAHVTFPFTFHPPSK